MPIGKVKTCGRDSLSIAFDARDRVGYFAITTTPIEKICKNQWCITRLTVKGPNYRQQSGPTLPTSWVGQPIIDPPDYRLTVIHPEIVRKHLLEVEARNAVANLPLFRDAKYGVQFRYPPDWTVRSASENRIVATPNRLAADPIQVVVGIRDKSVFPGSSPDLQLNLAEKTLLDANARIAKRGEMKVMQRIAPYLLGIYPESGNGTTIAHLQLVLDHGDQYYWISYTAPSEIYPDHTPGFATILKTFDIIPPGPQPAAAAPKPAE